MSASVVSLPHKVLRVAVEGLEPGALRLAHEASHYVLRVHRLPLGAELLLFDPASAREAEARLVRVERGVAVCELGPVRPSAYRPHPIRLLQALGKADKPERVIRDATALGVASIVLVQTERSVVRLEGERAGARRERWRRVASEASRQCGRGDLPAIEGPLALEEALQAPSDAAAARLVLAPGAPPLFERLELARESSALTLLVGPEGGLSAAELARAEEVGFVRASLGSTILRTELAGIAALGALVAWLERAEGRRR